MDALRFTWTNRPMRVFAPDDRRRVDDGSLFDRGRAGDDRGRVQQRGEVGAPAGAGFVLDVAAVPRGQERDRHRKVRQLAAQVAGRDHVRDRRLEGRPVADVVDERGNDLVPAPDDLRDLGDVRRTARVQQPGPRTTVVSHPRGRSVRGSHGESPPCGRRAPRLRRRRPPRRRSTTRRCRRGHADCPRAQYGRSHPWPPPRS